MFGREISKFISDNRKMKIKKFFIKFNKNEILFRFLIYLYVAFTPLPNNALTAVLAINDYPYKKLFAPLWLGNMTLPIIIIGFSLLGV